MRFFKKIFHFACGDFARNLGESRMEIVVVGATVENGAGGGVLLVADSLPADVLGVHETFSAGGCC